MYKRLSSRTLLSHPRLTLVEDQVELPNGRQSDYVWIDYGSAGGVTVIARDEQGKLLVEREYSYLPNDTLFQFPGGGIHPGEQPVAAANRELGEEVNLHANDLRCIGSYLIDHRQCHALMHVFVGEKCVFQESTSKDEYEVGIEEHWLTEDEIDALIAEGRVVNAPMLASWAIYKASKR